MLDSIISLIFLALIVIKLCSNPQEIPFYLDQIPKLLLIGLLFAQVTIPVSKLNDREESGKIVEFERSTSFILSYYAAGIIIMGFWALTNKLKIYTFSYEFMAGYAILLLFTCLFLLITRIYFRDLYN
ncbi:MAG: hypothetical protein QNJ53_04885 [Pleurocapsa sp. MO_192.B19]|nr:hypothetical protein [Pleurocapsa sp. MO_192.B19]